MKRSFFFSLATLSVISMLAMPVTASAWDVTGIGGKFGYLSPEGRSGTPSVDVNLEIEDAGSQFHIVPGFSYWKKNGLSDKNPNLDVYYHFKPEYAVSPYLGTGLGMHIYNSDRADIDRTDPGANFFGGLRFPGHEATMFIEGRYVATDISQALIRGGVTLNLNALGQ